MIKKLPIKFAERELDEFIDSIYKNFQHNAKDTYLFDLTEVEYIANQELLVLSSLFKSMYESKIDFKVLFFKEGVSTRDINDRVKRQIIQFWEVWKIWKIVSYDSYIKYFGFDGNTVQRLQQELNYYPIHSEIYNRHGVTPFISLDFINNYSEVHLKELINPIYDLNSAIKVLLKNGKCFHPFTSNSLSTIITEELYLNFLEHSLSHSFNSFQKMAFMSISFHNKLDDFRYSEEKIQSIKEKILGQNFLKETIDFHYDKKNKKYKNNPYIQFSFLDFGQGIANTLRGQFYKEFQTTSKNSDDFDILQYAFNHYTSRHQIYQEKSNSEYFIPRGLFDVLSIVKRYKGLMIVRSNYGKIIYNFSDDAAFDNIILRFGNPNNYFPGTLISLYIPAIEDSSKLNISSIKPEINFAFVKPKNKKYISINSIVEKLQVPKEELYSKLLRELKKSICSRQEYTLAFVSFKGGEISKRIIKKAIYFLLTDYDINHQNNVVILNSPPENIVNEIATEILVLNDALKNYKIHPLPIIDFDENNQDLNIKWLGIYDDTDKIKLNDLIYEQYSIAKSDFRDPSNIAGHLNEFDSYGNLISNFPNRNDIINFYRVENEILTSKQVEKLIVKHKCLKKDDGSSVYLCSGNYYQKEYIELSNLLNDKDDCNTVAQLLYSKLKLKTDEINNYKFIGITTSSHKILKSFELQRLISSNDYICLDNYSTFESELTIETVDIRKKYVLVCDVISTGQLTDKVNYRLAMLGTELVYVLVISSILHPDFPKTKAFLNEFKGEILYLNKYPIVKFYRNQIKDWVNIKKIIRINPHTNIPIRLSISETNFNESIIFKTTIKYIPYLNEIFINNQFLNNIKDEAIHVGFLKFNNVIHPYFFNTEKILENLDEGVLKDIFKKINNPSFNSEKIQIFYPRKSGIDYFNFSQLKVILKNQHIEEIEIERFGTPEGWRFPHNTDYLSAKIENNFCFILDDGSCSGDSLIQMIDEISFYDAKEIVLLCIIGRVNDHKREFFSRISKIKVRNGKSIPISIYFVSHWHIPTYYLDENPNFKETIWLNEIINLQNTPQNIKKIAYSILKEIKPKSYSGFLDYKYLPRKRDDNEIAKKSLLLIREEIGKVIGYRLYVESFAFFDIFMQKYEKKINTVDRYKEIELLCATLIYEPYLYEKIASVLPDVVEQLEGFVKVLIFENESINHRLTFEWNKKDIVHLFFIVFKNEKLISELTFKRLKKIMQSTLYENSTINYILFKLLVYFPINTQQFLEKKYDQQLRELVEKLRDNTAVDNIDNKEIRKYYNFISTLPSRQDFASQLSQLKLNYSKLREPEHHDEKISFGHNVSELIVTTRLIIDELKNSKKINSVNITTIRKCWLKISNFTNPILSFSKTFEDFLLPFTFRELVNQSASLRSIVGSIEDAIFSTNETLVDFEKLDLIIKNTIKIQHFIDLNSTFHQIVENHQSNLPDFVSTLKNELKKQFLVTENVEFKYSSKVTFNIPELYTKKLLINELVTNMSKYCSIDQPVHIEISYNYISSDLFEVKIKNNLNSVNSQTSNGEGTKCFKLLSDSEIFGFKYESKASNSNYSQTLTFKLI